MTRRQAVWVVQAVIILVVAVFVWRTLADQWNEFRALDLELSLAPEWLGAAAGIVLVTYGLLVDAWRRVLRGWDQRLGWRQAVRIWTFSNLGRYIPGKVWSIAGLAVLAQRAGIAGWAAAGSAVVMQALAVGTGVAVAAAAAPGAARPVWLAAAAAVAVGTVAILTWPAAVRLLARAAGGLALSPLTPGAVSAAAAVTIVSWAAYGVAFWCLARGLLGPAAAALDLGTAVGVFAAGYIAGLIALFAPGGIGVREVVFLGLLTPPLGGAGALALTLGSRVLLTLTEIAAAAGGMALRPQGREPGSA